MIDKKVYEDNIAYTIHQIGSIRGEKPGKKMLHKILYLVQAKGVNLDLEYGIHFYGPYSATLDATASALATDGIICFEYKGLSHLMGINDVYDVRSCLEGEEEATLKAVIERYKDKNPTDLELITTAHYVKDKLPAAEDESIIAGVRKIKADKYSETAIREAIGELNTFFV